MHAFQHRTAPLGDCAESCEVHPSLGATEIPTARDDPARPALPRQEFKHDGAEIAEASDKDGWGQGYLTQVRFGTGSSGTPQPVSYFNSIN